MSEQKPYETQVTLNAYQIANLRWMLRHAYRLGMKVFNEGKGPTMGALDPSDVHFNTGDWFGEVPFVLAEAAKRVADCQPNGRLGGSGYGADALDTPSPWDRP